MKEQIIEVWAENSVKFFDKKKLIEAHGHFDPWICSGIGTILDLINKDIIKGTVIQHHNEGNNYIVSIVAFETMKDYKACKEIIEKKFERIRDENYEFTRKLTWENKKRKEERL